LSAVLQQQSGVVVERGREEVQRVCEGARVVQAARAGDTHHPNNKNSFFPRKFPNKHQTAGAAVWNGQVFRAGSQKDFR